MRSIFTQKNAYTRRNRWYSSIPQWAWSHIQEPSERNRDIRVAVLWKQTQIRRGSGRWAGSGEFLQLVRGNSCEEPMLTSRKTDRVRTRIRSDEHRDAHADRDSIANPGQSGRDDGTGNNPGVIKPCLAWMTVCDHPEAARTMLALVNGRYIWFRTGDTFHSDIYSTFESDMGGRFEVLQSGPTNRNYFSICNTH